MTEPVPVRRKYLQGLHRLTPSTDHLRHNEGYDSPVTLVRDVQHTIRSGYKWKSALPAVWPFENDLLQTDPVEWLLVYHAVGSVRLHHRTRLHCVVASDIAGSRISSVPGRGGWSIKAHAGRRGIVGTRVISTSITRAVISHLDFSGFTKGESKKRRPQEFSPRERQLPSVLSDFNVSDDLQLSKKMKGERFGRRVSSPVGSSRESCVVQELDLLGVKCTEYETAKFKAKGFVSTNGGSLTKFRLTLGQTWQRRKKGFEELRPS